MCGEGGGLLPHVLPDHVLLPYYPRAGEEGLDWGGVFRDAITRVVEDLFSQRFSLLVLCPNGVAQDGLNTDKYVPNPKHVTGPSASRALAMFEFIGRLMGASLRLKLCLPFDFPSLVRAPVYVYALRGWWPQSCSVPCRSGSSWWARRQTRRMSKQLTLPPRR